MKEDKIKEEEIIRIIKEITEKNKRLDIRKILSIGLYYCPSYKSTYLKMINSCVTGGYNEDYARTDHRRVLELDRVQDNLAPIWQKLENDLVLCQNMLHSWLKAHKDSPEIKDIRELPKFIRLIGDSVGKFVKKELKMELKKEEKHIYLHFDDPKKELSYHKDIIELHNERVKELESTIDV